MADRGQGSALTAGLVAEAVGGRLHGDLDQPIVGLCSVYAPRADHLCFAKNLDVLRGADPTGCGAVLLVRETDAGGLKGATIATPRPRLAFARAANRFFRAAVPARIDETARIHPSAQVAAGVAIGPNAVIGPEVVIGAGTEVRANVVIGPRVRIGARCVIKSNTVIGEEGFGVAKDEAGHNVRIPHFGSVVIGDDVEIGALNTVAAGTIDPTVVHDRVKTDDHVHIAHNCAVGEDTIITACAEISGSVSIGRDVWIGPNCSIINGVSLADGVFLGIGTVVSKSLTEKGVYAGVPARLVRRERG
jgi:UDP-3-O-[3-hydroxymyristoyl] glucosamine N-acyltransferase